MYPGGLTCRVVGRRDGVKTTLAHMGGVEGHIKYCIFNRKFITLIENCRLDGRLQNFKYGQFYLITLSDLAAFNGFF